MCVESHSPPVPVTVKLPAPVKPFTVMPFGAPLELTFVKVKAPVAVVTPTALPVVEETLEKENAVAPLVATVTASPDVVETLPKVAVEALVVPLKFTPPPPAESVIAPKAKVPLEFVNWTA